MYRRFKILNQFRAQQSTEKICLWTFDNYGTAPQTVFVFLVKLEDDPNTIMRHMLRLRPELLAQQKIFYPREFKQRFKFIRLSFVDVSSGPVRMLLSMVLGDSRAASNAATKAVEERVVDAILSDDEELACDLRQFNGREPQFLSFLAVVRTTLSQFLAEDKNRWQSDYDGTIVSNMSNEYGHLHTSTLLQMCGESFKRKP